MSFDELEQEFNEYYTKWLNEPIIKVKEELKRIITHILNLMIDAWNKELFD